MIGIELFALISLGAARSTTACAVLLTLAVVLVRLSRDAGPHGMVLGQPLRAELLGVAAVDFSPLRDEVSPHTPPSSSPHRKR